MQAFRKFETVFMQVSRNLFFPAMKSTSHNNTIKRPASDFSIMNVNQDMRQGSTCAAVPIKKLCFDDNIAERTLSLGHDKNVTQSLRKLTSYCRPLMDICGKTAIVTGGANGIGHNITHNLLCNGARVLMVDKDEEAGCKALSCFANQYGKGSIDFYHGDITNEENQQAFFRRCCDCFGQVNIVINNARIWDEVYWTHEVEVNFKAVMDIMLLSFQYLTFEPGKKGGLIINMSSTAALKPYGVSPIFSGTQRAVLGLTRSLSDQFFHRKYNIRMCTLCPGVTCTSILNSARQNMPTKEQQEEFDKVMAYEYKQNPDVVGAATMHLINEAPHGSTWIIENSDLYMIDFPHYKNYCIPSTLHVVCKK